MILLLTTRFFTCYWVGAFAFCLGSLVRLDVCQAQNSDSPAGQSARSQATGTQPASGPPSRNTRDVAGDHSQVVVAKDSATAALNEYQPSGRGRRGIWIDRNVLVQEQAEYELKVDVYRVDDNVCRPTVLMIHGGAWAVGDKWELEPLARQLVAAGLHAISTNYRLAPKHKFPAQLVDCQSTLAWIRENAAALHADDSQLGLWGYSAGAQLSALTAHHDREMHASENSLSSEPVRACVLGGLPSTLDYPGRKSTVFVYLMGATLAGAPELYAAAAPLQQVRPTMCPVFLYHGTEDKIVPYRLGVRMHERLSELSVESTMQTLDGRGHLGAFLDAATRRQVVQFLAEHLKPLEKASDASP